jgi:hypothetical protein
MGRRAHYLHEIASRLRLGQHPRLAIQQRDGRRPESQESIRLFKQNKKTWASNEYENQTRRNKFRASTQRRRKKKRRARKKGQVWSVVGGCFARNKSQQSVLQKVEVSS